MVLKGAWGRWIAGRSLAVGNKAIVKFVAAQREEKEKNIKKQKKKFKIT